MFLASAALGLGAASEVLPRGSEALHTVARRAYLRGLAAARANHLDEALVLLQEARSRALTREDWFTLARVELRRGQIATRRGEPAVATEALEEAVSAARRVPSAALEGEAVAELATIAAQALQKSDAVRGFNRAIELAQSAGDRRLEAQVTNSLGVFYLQQADYRRALATFKRAAAIEPRDPLQTAYIRNNLGLLHSFRAEADLAQPAFESALAEFERLGNVYGMLRALNNLGATASGRGRHREAEVYIRRALALAEERGDARAIPDHWHNLAVIYQQASRFDEAAAADQRSLELAEGQNNPIQACTAVLGLAATERLRTRLSDALTQAERAVACAARTSQRELFWQALWELGEIQRRRGLTEAAEAALREAVATIEAMSFDSLPGAAGQAHYPRGQLGPFKELLRVLVEAGRGVEALAVAEATKGRALLAATEVPSQGAAPPLAEAERALERRLQAELVRLNAELLGLRAEEPPNADLLAALTAKQRAARLALETFYSQLPPDRPASSRDALAAATSTLTPCGENGSWVAEYAVLEDRTYLFILPPCARGSGPRVEVVPLPHGERELDTLAELLTIRILARRADARDVAAELFQKLLAPLTRNRGPIETLTIVPDGPLWKLPFELLVTEDTTGTLSAAALSLAPSRTYLAALARRAPRRGQTREGKALLVVASAEGTEERALAALYGPAQTTVLAAAEATEERVKRELKGHHILHFATHAQVDDHSPLFSSLLLTPAAEPRAEDGLLEMWEIASLSLDAELVVLAACQTARGPLAPGEGMRGLAWAFAAAGSPAIVASLWEVDSAATGRLMIAFHRELRGGATAAQALSRAARDLRQDPHFAHPFYWAGFVLLGEGAPR